MSYIDDKTLLLVNNDEDNIIKPSLKETNLICYYDGRDTLTNSTITDRSNNSNNYTSSLITKTNQSQFYYEIGCKSGISLNSNDKANSSVDIGIDTKTFISLKNWNPDSYTVEIGFTENSSMKGIFALGSNDESMLDKYSLYAKCNSLEGPIEVRNKLNELHYSAPIKKEIRYDLAVTYDNGRVVYYDKGYSKRSGNITAFSNVGDLTLGRTFSSSGGDLYLYYLRIYNTALTPIEIIQNYKYEELIKR